MSQIFGSVMPSSGVYSQQLNEGKNTVHTTILKYQFTKSRRTRLVSRTPPPPPPTPFSRGNDAHTLPTPTLRVTPVSIVPFYIYIYSWCHCGQALPGLRPERSSYSAAYIILKVAGSLGRCCPDFHIYIIYRLKQNKIDIKKIQKKNEM